MKLRFFRTAALVCLIPALALAQSTWVGGTAGNVVNNAANWSPASVPGASADLVFNTTSNTSVGFNNLNYTANSLSFGSTANYTLNFGSAGGTFLTLGAGGLTTSSTGTVTINSGLNIALGANQTWSNASTVNDNGNISGAFTLTKSGAGQLNLNGNNSSFSGGITVTSGNLGLGNSNAAGTGAINVNNGAFLSGTSGDVSLSNTINLASGANLGGSAGTQGSMEFTGTVNLGSAPTTTVNLGGRTDVFFGGTVSGSSTTALTVHGAGEGIAIMGGSLNNISSMTADNAAIAFANSSALPATIAATNGGYVSVATVSGLTAPTVTNLLNAIANKAGFNGTIGFDTDEDAAHPAVYSTNLDLAAMGFTAGNVRIGSQTSATLTGTITPVAQSYDFGGYSSQDGLLYVKSNLVDHGGTTGLTLTAPSGSGGTPGHGQLLGLGGTNTFTGNVTVAYSSLILDSAGALPATSNIGLGALSYASYTEAAGFANFAAFASRVTSSTATSILGIDSHDAVDAYVNSGTGTSVHTVSSAVDLSGFSSIYLGTHTGATITGTITAPTDGTVRLVNVGENDPLTISSVLNQSNGLVAGMSGTVGAVVLGTNNTFSGNTTLAGGQLLVGNGTTSALSSGTITVSGTGTGDMSKIGVSSGSATLSNNIAVTDFLVVGNGGYDQDNNNTFAAGTSALTLNGVISGSGARLYIYAPTTLNAANTYNFGTYIHANTTSNTNTGTGTGFVDLGYNAILTLTSANPVIGGLSDSGQFIEQAAGTGTVKLGASVASLTLSSNSGQTFSGQITGTSGASSASLIKAGSGQLNLIGNNAGQWTGGTVINAGNVAIGGSNYNSGGALVTTATFGGNVTINNAGALIFRPGNGQTMDYNGSISGAGTGSGTSGNAAVFINGGGTGVTKVSGGSSSFTGATSVNTGTLWLAGDNLWSSASATTINAGTTLKLDGNQTLKNLGGGGAINLTTGGKTLTVDSASSSSLSGVISGSGNLAKTGSSTTLTLTANNTFTGTTTVSAGTLQLGNGGAAGSLGGNGGINVAAGATLGLNRSGSASFGNVISGMGTLLNTAGINTLTAANTYTGTTTVAGGTLKLSSTGSIAGTSGITVNSGATFDVSSVSGFTFTSGQTVTGSGTVIGPFTAGTGSHIAPGTNGAGIITFTGGLTLSTGSILDFSLGSTYDTINVTSGVLTGPSGTGGVTLNLSDTGSFAANTYNIFNFTGATTSGFDVADFTLGSTISGYNYNLQLNGNLLQLVATATPVPEPATTAALLGLGAAGLVIWRRRRLA